MTIDVVRAGLQEASQALTALLANEPALAAVAAAGALMASSLKAGHKMYSCGNGGSLCDAMHFAEELSGRFRDDRPAYAAMSISDPGHMSCVGNDYGYEQVFSRFMQAHGRKGDVLLAISTSGTSKNVLAAVAAARVAGVHVVGLTGQAGSGLALHSDIAIVTPAGRYADRVQELHIKCIHMFIEIVERALVPQNYLQNNSKNQNELI